MMNRTKCRTHSYRYASLLTRISLAASLALIILCAAPSAKAVKLTMPNAADTFIDVRLLMQPQIQLIDDLAADPKFSDAFFLRRTRIMLGGQMNKWVSFFAETDQPNWGKNGNWSSSANPMYIQDAYVSFDLHESFKVYTGLLLLPFVHQSLQSAANLNTLDYHGDLIKYPMNSSQTWRNAGVGFRGLAVNKKLDYRLTITRGVANNAELVAGVAEKPATATTPAKPPVAAVTSNTKDAPRFTGRVAYNFFDAEDGVFLGGTYLGQKKILSIGAAFDVQPGAAGLVAGDRGPYFAFGGDVFLDLPLANNQRLSGQLDFVYYGGEKYVSAGTGLLFDLGYAIGKWEPVIALDWFKPKTSDGFKQQFLGVHGGVNYWLLGHGANIKLDIGYVKETKDESDKGSLVTTIQTQLLF